MANKDSLFELLGSSKMLREPFRSRMPIGSPEATKRYLHQVWLLSDVHPKYRQKLIIRLELYGFEKVESAEPVAELEGIMADYVHNGQFDLTLTSKKEWGRVTFVRKGDGAVMWPERYALHPTFSPEDLKSSKLFRKRLAVIDGLREGRPSGRHILIDLRWDLVVQALETGERVDDTRFSKVANLYQAFATERGTELWVARLPNLSGVSGPDENGFVEVSPRFNGVAVLLTADFLRNLLEVIPHIMEDPLAYTKAFFRED